MQTPQIRSLWFLCLTFALVSHSAVMQELTVPVPSLIGLNEPQAQAALNRVGLALGAQSSTGWTAESGLPQNTISAQSIPADQPVPSGTPIEVTVLRSTNVVLIYDDNDLTIINATSSTLDANGLVFGIREGPVPAAFAATRWSGALEAGACAQVWSVVRSVPKDIEGCARINHWLTTNNTAEHFWTALNSAVRFNIIQNGIERGICPAAPVGSTFLRCDLYLPATALADVTAYIYFAYTPERLIILNQSSDKWMPLDGSSIFNNNPNLTSIGQQVDLTDPSFVRATNPVANLALLAPNQCILFSNNMGLEVQNLPQPCDVVGQGDIAPELIFWAASFDISSVTGGLRTSCPAATLSRLTICVMPR